MKTIQHVRGISFAGAWLNYGFHEDGFTSGLRAAVGIIQDTPDLAGMFRARRTVYLLSHLSTLYRFH